MRSLIMAAVGCVGVIVGVTLQRIGRVMQGENPEPFVANAAAEAKWRKRDAECVARRTVYSGKCGNCQSEAALCLTPEGDRCDDCMKQRRAGRAFAEGVAEVLMPMLERLAKPPVYNIINDNTARPDLKSFIDTLEKKL